MAEPALLPQPDPEPGLRPGPEPDPRPTLRVLDGPPPSSPKPLQPRLEIPPYDLPAALALERELGISHVLAQILVRRGLSEPASARGFLEPAERHDPSAFAGIEATLELIASHLRAGSRIVVHGDYDVD